MEGALVGAPCGRLFWPLSKQVEGSASLAQEIHKYRIVLEQHGRAAKETHKGQQYDLLFLGYKRTPGQSARTVYFKSPAAGWSTNKNRGMIT